MNKLLLLSGLALVAQPAKAQSPLEITSNAAIVADCATTVHALKDPTYGESNPLLGVRPSAGKVIGFCAVALGANEGLTRLIFPHNKTARNIVWGLVSATELWMVHHNLNVTGVIRF